MQYTHTTDKKYLKLRCNILLDFKIDPCNYKDCTDIMCTILLKSLMFTRRLFNVDFSENASL